MVENIVDKIQLYNCKSSEDNTTLVLANNNAPPLEGGYSKNIGGMWNIKHEIRSPRFYELLTNT